MEKRKNEHIDVCFETLFYLYYKSGKTGKDYYNTGKKQLKTLIEYKEKLSFSQLIDVASYWIEFFNDDNEAKNIIRYAVTKSSKNLKTTFNLSDKMVKAYCDVSFRYWIDCEERFSDNEQERYIDENTIRLLVQAFDIIISTHENVDLPLQEYRSSLYEFDDGYALEWGIIRLLSLYSRDREVYITRLERLLVLRLKYMRIPTEKITDFIFDDSGNDDEYVYDLGMWYIKKNSCVEKEKGFKYLLTGLSISCFSFDIERCTTVVECMLSETEKSILTAKSCSKNYCG